MPFPAHIKIFWMVVLSGYLLWSFWPLWKVDITLEEPEHVDESDFDEKEKDE